MAIFSKKTLDQIKAQQTLDAPRQTVMIVDDEEANRSVMAAILRSHYNLLEASDGREALALIERLGESEAPACIVSDHRMPNLSGVELFERAERLLPHTIRIIVTGFVDIGAVVDSINKAKIYKFIVKPFDADDFLLTVKRAVESYDLERQVAAHHAQLQDEVRIRTRELVDANQVLQERNGELQALNRQLEAVHTQLLQSEKMASIGQLAAGVAHEINNPVGFVYANIGSLDRYVRGMLRLLALHEQHHSAGNGAENTDALAALKKEIDYDFLIDDIPSLLAESREGLERVKKIVQDLKDFSRVDSQDWQFANINKCLDSTLTIATNEIKYKAQVVKEYGDIPEVECLPSQLNQVFLNLLVNASHAIAEKGTITIRTGKEGDHAVWIEVADTGCGIAQENLTRIFDPFFTTKPVGQGTGLGLSISYGIVKKHGGKIEVDSQAGQGSRFRLSIPIRRTIENTDTAPKA